MSDVALRASYRFRGDREEIEDEIRYRLVQKLSTATVPVAKCDFARIVRTYAKFVVADAGKNRQRKSATSLDSIAFDIPSNAQRVTPEPEEIEKMWLAVRQLSAADYELIVRVIVCGENMKTIAADRGFKDRRTVAARLKRVLKTLRRKLKE